MTAIAHALVAGAIASKVSDPTAVIFLSVSSHFIMDSIPHWDLGTNWRNRTKTVTGMLSIAETLLGMTVAYFVFRDKAALVPLSLAIVASLLPDWLETPWYIFFAKRNKQKPARQAGIIEKIAYRVYKFENLFHSKAQLPFGLFTQVVTVAFFLLLLI